MSSSGDRIGRLGALPAPGRDGRVPGLGAAAPRGSPSGSAARRHPLDAEGGGRLRRPAARRPGRRLPVRARRRRARSPIRARASSPRGCAGRRGSSRSRRPRARGLALDEARDLRAPRRHVLGGGDVRRRRSRTCAGLRELGVTAIELMPVATFPGERGWGYDGVYASAPHRGLRRARAGSARLVDAAHREGLGVILDVVYNHVGPGSEALTAFGPYFTDRHRDVLGRRRSTSRSAASASGRSRTRCMWVSDYGIDGLRLDAVHAIERRLAPSTSSPSSPTASTGRAPRALVDLGDRDRRRPADSRTGATTPAGRRPPPRAARAADRRARGLLRAVRKRRRRRPRARAHAAERHVVCAQNHDQVGNRALGDRLPRDLLRVASSVVLFARADAASVHGRGVRRVAARSSSSPTTSTRRSPRRRARAGGASSPPGRAFAGGDVPDPQAPETFARSKLSRRRGPRRARPLPQAARSAT